MSLTTGGGHEDHRKKTSGTLFGSDIGDTQTVEPESVTRGRSGHAVSSNRKRKQRNKRHQDMQKNRAVGPMARQLQDGGCIR